MGVIRIPTSWTGLGRIAGPTLIYGFASTISKIAGLLLIPIYTRVFDTQEYGRVEILLSISSLVSLFGLLQLESAMARFFHEAADAREREEFVSTISITVAGVSAVWVTLVALSSDWLATLLFRDPTASGLIRLSAVVAPFMNLFAIASILLRFEKRVKTFACISLLQFFVTVGLSLLFVVRLDLGIRGLLLGQLIGWIVAASAASILSTIRYLRPTVRWESLRKFFNYSLPQLPGALGGWLNLYGSRFVMLAFLTESDVGVYGVAVKLVSVFYLIDNAFRMAWFPVFWETYKKPESQLQCQRVFQTLSVVIFSVVVVFTLAAPVLLALIAPPSYGGAYHLLGLMAMAAGLRTIAQPLSVGPDVANKMLYNTLIVCTSAILNLLLLLTLVPTLGLLGAVISQLLTALAVLTGFWIVTERLHPTGFPRLTFMIGFSIAIGTSVCAYWVNA